MSLELSEQVKDTADLNRFMQACQPDTNGQYTRNRIPEHSKFPTEILDYW